MELSMHPRSRSKQRGIPTDAIDIIYKHGRESFATKGAQKIFFGKKECGRVISELKKLIKAVERTKGGALLISNGQILTVYKNFWF